MKRLESLKSDFVSEVSLLILPVSFQHSFTTLEDAIDTFNPSMVICMGLSANSCSINIEAMAKNTLELRVPDNDGAHPSQKIIDTSGPETLQSTLPIDYIVTFLKGEKIPVEISNDAGEYVCNYLMYKSIQLTNQRNIKCGFIHIPMIDQSNYINLNDTARAFIRMLNSLSTQTTFI